MKHLTPEILLKAYAYGVFPMAESRNDPNLYWIDPEVRGIIPLERFHVPRRLARTVRASSYDIRVDTAFRVVLEACAEPAADRPNTWINEEILDIYTHLHAAGRAHSVECWHDGRLVGGLYGVSIGAAFFGESMFTRERDASKIALVHLVARLKAGDYRLLDTQFVTEHLARFGAVEISREAYHRLLRQAVSATADFYSISDDVSPDSILQSATQTS